MHCWLHAPRATFSGDVGVIEFVALHLCASFVTDGQARVLLHSLGM